MSNAATRALHGLFKWAFAIGIVAVGLLALLVAWWIAALVVVSWLVYAGARRLLSGKRTGVATPGVAATIDGEFAPATFAEQSEMRLSRDELLKASGLDDAQLVELESFGLIAIRGRHYDGDALSVAKAVAEMAGFGIEPRHLRSFKSAADREIGLIEQVITPFTRQKSTEAKARAEEVQKEIASLSVRLHAALVRGGLNRPR